jgi:branched-chain amino acid transport system ATP-binding protein
LMEVLLEGDRISKFFGGLEAIHDLSFQVPKGDITGLIGPNGAGKTTLINLITAIHPLSAGKIRFKGKDITHAKSYEIGQMGIARTFQIVKPFSGMTVEENILIGAWFGKSGMKRTKQEALKKVGQVLELVGLKKKQGALVEQTTIPDRKKLELAKALAMEPELLFLDEVMAGLTPKETEDMMVLVKDLKRKGITILVIEHVMKAIMGISDQILVLDQGKLIARGTPEEISTNERVIEAYLGARYAQKRGVGAGHA